MRVEEEGEERWGRTWVDAGVSHEGRTLAEATLKVLEALHRRSEGVWGRVSVRGRGWRGGARGERESHHSRRRESGVA